MRKGSREAIITRSGTWENEVATEEQLSGVQTPTLIMWGQDDQLLDVSIAHRFQTTLPNASLIIYEQVRHIPMEEIPERSSADMKDFLSTIR